MSFINAKARPVDLVFHSAYSTFQATSRIYMSVHGTMVHAARMCSGVPAKARLVDDICIQPEPQPTDLYVHTVSVTVDNLEIHEKTNKDQD